MVKNHKSILMVDDDVEDRFLLKDAFDELKYSDAICFQENGEKAIEYLRICIEGDCLPRLIILDLNMPKLNGRQTLKWIKSESILKDIIVVIYSTSLNPIERDECLAMGAHSYVIKPISYKESLSIAREFYLLSNSMH